MMKRIVLLVVAVAFLFSLSACAVGIGGPVTGLIYKNATGPYLATDNTVGSKKGKATATSVLGLFGFGDASIAKAAENGGIKKIATVDQQGTNFLSIIATSTTIVTGE